MRQEAEAEVRKRRRVVLDELCGDRFELSLLPAWTPRLLQRLHYSADASWLDALVTQGFCYKKAARRVWRQATPAAPEYAVYEVTEQWRTWVLDMFLHDDQHQLTTLQNHMSKMATAIQPLVAEDPRAVPEATRYWALLAWQTYVEGFQQTLHAHVDDALADNQNHRAMAFVTCARRLVPYLEPRAALVVEGAARRLEVTRRRQADADKLRHYLVREQQVKAFHAVLDDPDTWALHYLGMGGMGKTMLLRYLLSERQPGRDYIAARIDFDFLDPDYPTRSPGLLLEALGEELRLQDTEGHTGTLFTTLSNEILGFHEVVQLDEAEGRIVSLAEHPRFDHVLSLFADMIRHLKKPVVFLLDTCEELVGTRVDGNRTRAVTDTFAIFEALRGKNADFTLIFAGRRLLAKAGCGWTIHPDQAPALPARDYLRLFALQPFSATEAGLYFQSRAVAESRRDDLLRLCRTDVSLVLDGITDTNAGVYYSPFDCALYCDWLAQEPDLDLSGAAEGEDRYVARRVVGRITDNTLKQWLPAMALLGRFDQATFTAFVAPIPEEIAQVAWLDCTGLEWVNAEGHFLAVLEGLRGRLLRWFKRERPSAPAAAKTKLLEILGRAIAANPTGVDPEYVIDVIRLSDPKRLALWWPALRDALVKDSQFERLQAIFRRLTVKADQYEWAVPEPVALDALLLEARDHAWDGAFNWLPFLEKDETGRAFFAYLTQSSAVIDEFADRFFAANPEPLPSFKAPKAAVMVLGMRIAPPGKEDQPVFSPGKARLEAWRDQIPADPGLTSAVFKACEAYLACRESAVQRKVGHAYLRSLLEEIVKRAKDSSVCLYAEFLRIRLLNAGRRRATLQKELRHFLSCFQASKCMPAAPDLYWSCDRDLSHVIRFFLLRYFRQGVLEFDDVRHLLFERHDTISARFCSFFYFQRTDSLPAVLPELVHYPVEPLPLQLQVPRDQGETLVPRLALLACRALDAPQPFAALVGQQLADLLEESETKPDAATLQQAVRTAIRRVRQWFSPLPISLSDEKRGALPIDKAFLSRGLDLEWIHHSWSRNPIRRVADLEQARQGLLLEKRALNTSAIGIEVALDVVEFNLLAKRWTVPPIPLKLPNWSLTLNTLYRQRPLQHQTFFRLMIRRWALGLGRKPNMKRFKARLGVRRFVSIIIDVARVMALRFPDRAYPLYQNAIDCLPAFDPARPLGFHLICYADLWHCRSLPDSEMPTPHVLPDIDDLIPLYQHGEPLEGLGAMLVEARARLEKAVMGDDEDHKPRLPVQVTGLDAQGKDAPSTETLGFSLGQSVKPTRGALIQMVIVIRTEDTPKKIEKELEFTLDFHGHASRLRLDLNDTNKPAMIFFSKLLSERIHNNHVIALRLMDSAACLPAWESAYDWFGEGPLVSAWHRAYRRILPKLARLPKQGLASAMIMGGEKHRAGYPFHKLWQSFELGSDNQDFDILHLIGRPMRLGNGAFRLGLGDAGHRAEGALLAPETIGVNRRIPLVLVQMPAEDFKNWHILECAYGRGFAGALVEQGFADAVLFLPPLFPGLWDELQLLSAALFQSRGGNWPNALLHAVGQLRLRISRQTWGSGQSIPEVAGQICLTTAFEIEIEPFEDDEE